MKVVGITGQTGFIGTHLFNFLSLKSESFKLIPFKDDYFDNLELFDHWVKSCDVVVHLAALNRHNDPDVIFEKNIELVNKLIEAMERTGAAPLVVFASSTQETRDNPYGRSKKEGRLLLERWAERNNAGFLGLIIPNVFGPFGTPFYNSVVSTFSYQLTHDQTPSIEIDAVLPLIYVGDLVKDIASLITGGNGRKEIVINPTAELKVSGILELLKSYKENYFS